MVKKPVILVDPTPGETAQAIREGKITIETHTKRRELVVKFPARKSMVIKSRGKQLKELGANLTFNGSMQVWFSFGVNLDEETIKNLKNKVIKALDSNI